MSRRFARKAVGTVVVLGVVAGGGFGARAALAGAKAEDPASAPTTKPTATAPVVRRDLAQTESQDGSLGYGEATGVGSRLQGTLTKAPAVGAVIQPGQDLFEVDGKGVPLLVGARPMWRRLAEGVGDGADVEQLERALRALGYDKGKAMTLDGHLDADTTASIKRWQKARSVEQTGVVELGDAVFLPAAVRVSALSTTVGDALAPGAPVLKVTGTSRQATLELSPTKVAGIKAGDAVTVTLPDQRTTPGAVTSVADAAVAQKGADGQAGSPTVEVLVSVPDAGTTFDEAPVSVAFVRDRRSKVLAVPVTALLALAEGGYGVELVDGPTHRLVGVKTGLFADSMVEVIGPDLREGVTVVVPA